MELKLEVVLSSSIKRKKPWPRFCWLGQEKQSVFLLDDKRISEINLVSGRTKKRTPKLHPLLNNVVTMASSSNGVWLCGLLKTGQIFMWNRDKDVLKITTTVPEVADFTSSVQGFASRLSVQVSGDGLHVLLVAVTGEVFLWQCADVRDLIGVRDSTVKGNWSQIQASNDTMLPTSQDKEAYVHTLFVKTEALGDVCLSTFVFTSGNKLIISCLKIIWGENQEKIGPVNYSVKWATKTFLMSSLKPPCQPVKSRGALVSALSPDGQLLAVVLNQRQPQATQVLFVSTVNFVSVSRSLGGCGCKKMSIPSKYIRSYWVGCVSWSAGGLFLACVLKRGSLLMLARLGGLLTLSTSGCNIDFGPAHFLPLHPLVTYRYRLECKGEASLSSSSLSVRDVMRQRYSVTCHPQLFYFIVSDGYMATVVRVFDKISPALLLRALLNDTTTDLEKVWFDSVSALNVEKSLLDLGSTYRLKSTDVRTSADGSTLPFFLQDQGTMGNARDILETVVIALFPQTFFDDDSDVDGVPPGSHVEEGGRLEFASMFDTLHALNTHYEQVLESDSEQGSSVGNKMSYCDLEKMETKLLSAWAFGLSLGNFGESKSSLLKHAMKCTVRFAALSQLRPSSMVHSESEADHTLNFLKKLFHFTPWDRANSEGPLFVGIMVELCRNLVQLVLTPYTEAYCHHNCEISSHNLLTALQIIQMFTQSLDQTYSLQQRCVWSDVKESSEEPELWPSDLHSVPVLQTETREETNLMHRTSPAVQLSRRLHGIWVWIYTITQKYMCELEHLKGYENWEREKQQVIVIMCQIQTVLQASGERLEEPNKLRDYSGEDRFLCGFYTESSEVWFSQLLETRKKSGKATVFQEKRLCLALLYSLLSQYHLKQAQELGDHMVCLILQTHKHQEDGSGDDSFQCPWLSEDVSTDAAYAVVQTLGRFMASYFSNQPLYILPPHSVDVLPPVHLPHASSLGRLVPLCQAEVSRAVRQQQLSGVWTVEFAQDLLMLGALFPEAVWLAYHLGDWKAAVSLSQAYSCYCKHLNRRELFLPRDLQPANILQSELKCLLGDTGDSNEQTELDANHSVSDPVDEEDWGLLHVSIQDILKASVMAGVDAVSSPLSSLLDKAKDFCSCLSALVPTALYLPSPPLYCPQPSPNTQDPVGTVGYHTELSSRHKISEVIQKLLLVLRSANCCSPAAQWYLRQLRRARHILYKCGFLPLSVCSFVQTCMSCALLSGCFRELCGLCWMLHVRDQLSLSCRKYQAGRQKSQEDSEVRSPCVDALQWAQRFLPFSRFLNCEEIVQDTILSLLSELPPVSLVADALVQSFPEEEESVRVPLREKYNTIMQTLKQCNVVGAGNETGEIMMVFIQDKLRLRKKHLNRLRRNLAPLEIHLWEKEIEEEEDRTKQLSLGTSLSTSTLTDCGLLPVHSDADIHPVAPSTKESKIRDRGDETKTSKKVKNVITGDGPSGGAKDEQRSSVKQPSLPSVGSWEFELEDAEYLNFLELFLSYLLEKEPSDSSNELPLLKDFSHKLREKELHSLAFDVLTSLHRRQRDGHRQVRNKSETHIFRAGSCFRPETQGPAAMTSAQSVSQKQASSSGFPQRTAGVHKGLFNHQTQLCDVSQRSIKCSSVRSSPQTQTSESLRFCSVAPAVELIQGLNAELEAQFPELGRLLEWLMRWADRRLLLGQHGKNREKRRGQTADGVVIRVKASAPAVLTSLRLMQRRYTALFGMDRTHMQIAHTQWSVGPVLQPPTHRKVEKEKRRVDTSSALTSDTASRVLELMSSALFIFHVIFFRQTKTSPHTESLTGSAEKEESVVHDAGSKLQSSSQSPDPHTERPLAAPPFAPPAAPPLVSHVPEAQTPEMRQRLGEDLYRLVQNINYMSLMEVLGASFSNLQLAQQNISAQSNFNLSVNLPFLNNAMTPPSVPHPTEPPPSVPRPSEPLTGPSPPPEHRPQGPVCVHSGSRGLHSVNMNLQTPPFTHGPVLSGGPEMSPLSVEAGSPVRNSRNNLIPCTEGLLTTADLKQTVPQNPVLPPSTCSPQSHAAPLQSHAAPLQSHAAPLQSHAAPLQSQAAPLQSQAAPLQSQAAPLQSQAAPLLSGLKLLQLHSPQFSAHVSRHGPQSPQNHPQTESGPSMFKHNDLMRFTRGHIRFTLEAQYQPVPVNSNQTRLKGREAPRLPLASPVWTESAPQRLKLLHVQPVSNSNITLPRLSPGPGPPSAQTTHTGPAPRIRLLQLEPQPKMVTVIF
uniref:Ciliogenesis and planar polarity effector 1 n=1 Tax=Periophthalmus magnuspinnatus TaxID=409849 RepID=A0A3B4AUS7_9GOBI